MQVHQHIQQKIEKKTKEIAFEKLNSLNLPTSLLIIPDGNGRWAKSLGLSVYEGHQKGAQVFAKILDNFLKLDIKVLGAWGFSEDNWKRPQDEIEKVMEVIEATIRQNLEKLKKNNVRFIVLGKKEKIAKEFPKLWKTLEEHHHSSCASSG